MTTFTSYAQKIELNKGLTPKIDKTYCDKCEKMTMSKDNPEHTCYKCSECEETK
jgi:PHP family Zn ribbon phosphoesterase